MRQNDSQLENHQHSQEIDCFPNSKKKRTSKRKDTFSINSHLVYIKSTDKVVLSVRQIY